MLSHEELSILTKILQLTVDSYEAPLSLLSEVVEQTETDCSHSPDNSDVLDSVADYFTELVKFVNATNAPVNSNVRECSSQLQYASL